MTTAPSTYIFNNRTLVQTSRYWPYDDAGWTTQKMFATKASTGFANDVGAATLFHPGGVVIWPGSVSSIDLDPLNIVGQYVRVCNASSIGSVADDDGNLYEPLWWGKVISRSWKPNSDQTGLVCNYECAGIACSLDQVSPFHHYEVDDSGALADITLPLRFNGHGNKKLGNRSASTHTIAGISGVYVFDRTGTLQWLWTAQQVIEYLFALAKDTNPAGPTWSLAGATDALQYTERWELSSCNILEAINRLICPKNGLGYRVEVSGVNAIIHVVSCSKVAVTAGAFNLPANTEQAAVDITASTDPSVDMIDYSIKEDQSATYDRVAIIGGPDRYIITLGYAADESGGIIRDWTDADVDARNLALIDETTPQGSAVNAFCRFKLRPDWTGLDYSGAFTMPSKRSVTDVEPDFLGDGGYNGVVTTGGVLDKGTHFTIDKDLPLPVGYDWSSELSSAADMNKRNEKPQCFVLTGSGERMTLAEYCDNRDSVEVTIDESTASITVGPDNVAGFVEDLLQDGGTLYFTVSIQAQLPLMVSWNTIGIPPVDQLRSMVRQRSHLTRRTIVANTIFGVTSGSWTGRGSNYEVSSDMDQLNATLALAVAWYSKPEWMVEWTRRGFIDTLPETKPGTYYTQLTYSSGPGTSNTIDVDAIVTKREYDFTDGTGGTTITTRRIKLDVETVF